MQRTDRITKPEKNVSKAKIWQIVKEIDVFLVTIRWLCRYCDDILLFGAKIRGVEWSLKNYGSRQILHESRNLGVTNKSLEISSLQGRTRNFKFCNLSFGAKRKNRHKKSNNQTRLGKIVTIDYNSYRGQGACSPGKFWNSGLSDMPSLAFWVTFKLHKRQMSKLLSRFN